MNNYDEDSIPRCGTADGSYTRYFGSFNRTDRRLLRSNEPVQKRFLDHDRSNSTYGGGGSYGYYYSDNGYYDTYYYDDSYMYDYECACVDTGFDFFGWLSEFFAWIAELLASLAG